MSTRFLTAITAAFGVFGSAESIAKRQTSSFSGVVNLHAGVGPLDRGPLVVDSSGIAVIGSAGAAGSTFYIEESSGRLFTGLPDAASNPHGVLQFSNPSIVCRSDGPLIFTANETVSSAGCNVSSGFAFVNGTLKAAVPGLFAVCGAITPLSELAFDLPQVHFFELISGVPVTVPCGVSVELVVVPIVTSLGGGKRTLDTKLG